MVTTANHGASEMNIATAKTLLSISKLCAVVETANHDDSVIINQNAAEEEEKGQPI